MTKKIELVIQSTEDLEKLLREKRSLLKMPKRFKISLELPGITKADRLKYERRLSRLYSECGCSWGAIAGFAGLAVYLGAFLVLDFTFEWFVIPLAIFVFTISVAAGKIAGLSLARIQLEWIITEIADMVGQTRLEFFQEINFRNSRHVTYF